MCYEDVWKPAKAPFSLWVLLETFQWPHCIIPVLNLHLLPAAGHRLAADAWAALCKQAQREIRDFTREHRLRRENNTRECAGSRLTVKLNYSKSLAVLFSSCRFLCAHLQSPPLRLRLPLPDGAWPPPLLIERYLKVTFERIYLKMVNSFVSSRHSGAARPGCPPPLYPPTEVAWNTAPSVVRLGSRRSARERNVPGDARRDADGHTEAGPGERRPLGGRGSLKRLEEDVECGDGRGASM